MEAEMDHGETFHVTDPSASAGGPCSNPPPSAASPADDGLHYGEVEINYEENSATGHQILVHASFDELKEVERIKELLDEANSTVIDTAAPFASVRAAVTKFGGIVDVKTEETQNTERQKNCLLELKKIQEEALKHQKKYEETEASKQQILKELDDLKRLVEDLKLQVEKAETLEEQARLDSQLALLRLKEVEDGIGSSESAATKVQLDLAKERHATAVAELASVNQELASMQGEYASQLQERDHAVRRATENISSSKESEKSVHAIKLELSKTKALVESVHSAFLKAEERKVATALTLEMEKMLLEKAAKRAEEELERFNQEIALTNDVKSKLDDASTLLYNLKAELNSYNRKNEESATSTAELDEVKSELERAYCKVNCLRNDLYSLQSELESEKASLTTLKETEGSASVTISSLEEEIERMNTELQLILQNTEDMEREEIEMTLQPASEEAEKAKLVAESACEELRMAKKDAEQAKAMTTAMDMRLSAARGEFVAANKAIQLVVSSRVKATKDRDDSSNGVTITREEYHRLSKKANQVEEQDDAGTEISPISPEKLEEANESLREKKQLLGAAIEKAEMAEEEAILMERQLRRCRDEQQREAKMNGTASSPDYSAYEIDNDQESSLIDLDDVESLDGESGPLSPRQLEMSDADASLPENRRRKRMLIARVVMFLARKKVPLK